ncbi:MAG TPA: pantetheine-phosphate adenylyltransferase [Candidatus Hydrogenedentes bacterium]|jgi:pantetheine-phosphate adenylyltransferase|nr:MAG: Phosphopantetheine adenylyltransferase [Candidatus Hydrogenedentes bacterium ADurb.Bin170]HOH43823.1 pantetheine-phosphate adenylyltransferase [Candidatus Hydrogenedentota bacterium]HOM48980.1 pantetheine-phosphate adenylyltransferase [Candidatus Hydrogenedentota bacterium]HOR51556.1 pantetheine-phosphate adenylyltransferase [Candidatus Hydrogenedentota bacterium]HPK25456.1 pantetheine-phosphate adenylyltransferase [Candidatus Hydrogenedentota bacterium]
MSEKIALYAGSFDPPTLGHLDLIERASKIFDRLIVAVANNDQKTALLSVPERMELLRGMTRSMDRVEIDQFEGLTVEYAREKKAVALIRGLRVVSDFEFELSLAINNQKLNPEVDTVCLMPSEPYLFLSSRQVKEIARFGGRISHYVTPEVEKCLREKLRGE